MSAASDGKAPRRSRWIQRLLAIALGLLVLVLALEGVLWGLHLLHAPPRREGPLGDGTRTILCVGDSNTYGVHLPREESYPGQLQTLLQRWSGNPWRVVNAGYPGNNTADVRGALARQIRAWSPEILIVLAGVNNTWSLSSRQLWETPDREVEPSLYERMLQGSRVQKLARMALNQLASKLGGSLQADTKVVSPQDIRRTLEMDHRRIREICAEHGVRVLMADYPVHIDFTERNVNGVLREIAARSGTPLVDLHAGLLPVAYGLGYPKVMFADYHAATRGNYEVARLVLRALVEHAFLEARPEWVSVPPLAETLEDWPLRVLRHDARRARIALRGKASAPYRLKLLRFYARGIDKTQNASVNYKPAEQWSREELERRGLLGRLGADGRLELDLELPPEPEHPVVEGELITWLGWRLRLELLDEEGQGIGPPLDPVEILLDPAVLRSESGR